MRTIKIVMVIGLQLIIMSNSCKDGEGYYDYRLKIINKSSKTIYGAYSQEYPDTSIVFTGAPFYSNPTWKANANETMTLGRGGHWEDAFQERIHQKLVIFIFDAAIADHTPWDTIKKNLTAIIHLLIST